MPYNRSWETASQRKRRLERIERHAEQRAKSDARLAELVIKSRAYQLERVIDVIEKEKLYNVDWLEILQFWLSRHGNQKPVIHAPKPIEFKSLARRKRGLGPRVWDEKTYHWRAVTMNMRAAQKGIPGVVTGQDLRRVLEAAGFKCLHCSRPDRLEFDHINSFHRGGSNYPDNLQVLCQPCNLRKGTSQ